MDAVMEQVSMSVLRRLVKQVPPLYELAKSLRRRQRVHTAKRALRAGFRDHLDTDGVLKDYLFSLRITDRHFNQVLLLEEAITMLARERVTGALVECGTFTGGASAYLLRAALRNFDRARLPQYWGFDSFQGMPHAAPEDGDDAVKWLVESDDKLRPEAAKDGRLESTNVNRATLSGVRSYLQDSGYPDDKLHLTPGWFQDTLGETAEKIGDIALLRLDGDFYESTRTCLEQLGGQVVPKGIVIIDDYGAFIGCRKAVHEYLAVNPGFSTPFQYDAHQAFILKVS